MTRQLKRIFKERGLPAELPLASTIAGLWKNGEQGVWYDSSDLSTMFQDAAGTLPVYMPGSGQVDPPVGRILDKSGRGNHASQATTTSRPILSARYNMLISSEEFGGAAWLRTECSVITNVTTGPSGRPSEKIIPSTVTAAHSINQSVTSGPESRIARIVVKADGCDKVTMYPGSANTFANFDLTTASYTIESGVTSAQITSLGNGWYECSAIWPVGPTLSTFRIYTSNGTIGASAVAGDGVSGLIIDSLDIRPTNDGVGLPKYQQVVNANTYDTSGFPLYLKFDGVDDFLQSTSVDFSATSQVILSASTRKQPSATEGIILELSASSNTNIGTFALLGPSTLTPENFAIRYSGATPFQDTAIVATAPSSAVVSATIGLSFGGGKLRVNQTQLINPSIAGGGNFGNYPMYIGRRAGTSLPFNGRLYSLLIRGALTSDSVISKIERYLNQTAKVF